jgi:hypothetical protein
MVIPGAPQAREQTWAASGREEKEVWIPFPSAAAPLRPGMTYPTRVAFSLSSSSA